MFFVLIACFCRLPGSVLCTVLIGFWSGMRINTLPILQLHYSTMKINKETTTKKTEKKIRRKNKNKKGDCKNNIDKSH
jgi:hypothetical protein